MLSNLAILFRICLDNPVNPNVFKVKLLIKSFSEHDYKFINGHIMMYPEQEVGIIEIFKLEFIRGSRISQLLTDHEACPVEALDGLLCKEVT
jgi:hypothetical protein